MRPSFKKEKIAEANINQETSLITEIDFDQLQKRISPTPQMPSASIEDLDKELNFFNEHINNKKQVIAQVIKPKSSSWVKYNISPGVELMVSDEAGINPKVIAEIVDLLNSKDVF